MFDRFWTCFVGRSQALAGVAPEIAELIMHMIQRAPGVWHRRLATRLPLYLACVVAICGWQ
jgi:hypothetical protein